ncbi:MAG: 3-hydroxy-5-methyl-1-naphthoate 3-O-methyltransferase [Calditrichaeota bacterium]|nr:3-hydroxy-5-methyl-1-naphthoate 3-O-methyltransferase [Calditrichota bacterium]
MATIHGSINERRIALSRLAGGFRHSAAVLAGIHLGVFKALSDGPKSADTIAGELSLSPRGTRLLLDALTAIDLLARDNGRYSLHGLADEFLREGSPNYQGDILHHNLFLFKHWANLDEAVRDGKPVVGRTRERSREELRAYILGMHNTAVMSADTVADFLDLTRVRRILDLAGGPGTYLYTLLNRAPHARGAVFDRPEVVEIARERAAEENLLARVELLAGDMFADEIGGPWDLIILSNIVHSHGEDANRSLIGKAARALAGGGSLLVKDFFLDSTRTEPADAALFALNMLVHSESGRSYTRAEVERWLLDAGLTISRFGRVGAASGMILAERASSAGR